MQHASNQESDRIETLRRRWRTPWLLDIDAPGNKLHSEIDRVIGSLGPEPTSLSLLAIGSLMALGLRRDHTVSLTQIIATAVHQHSWMHITVHPFIRSSTSRKSTCPQLFLNSSRLFVGWISGLRPKAGFRDCLARFRCNNARWSSVAGAKKDPLFLIGSTNLFGTGPNSILKEEADT